MPREQKVAAQNNFSKGLITEATGLTFPENAATDTDNCVFDQSGLVTRRLGFDLESNFALYTQPLTGQGNAVVTYLWDNVAGEGDISFVVAQIGDFLHFYRVSSEAALSDSKHITVLNMISTFAPVGITSVSTLECQFSSGNGLLFVTNRNLNSFYVQYTPSTDSFASFAIDIKIRDFEGDTADALAVDERPAVAIGAMTAAHRYNLQNQGWTLDTLTDWDTARIDMPSNSDVSWYFKNATDQFDFTTVDDRLVGNSPAPKGHYIYSVYNFNRSSNFAGATDYVIPTERVTTSAFFAGRVFYSGLRVEGQNSKIYFSQIVEDKTQYGKCYQTNDPTSEQLFDLLPTDGGVIDLIEAGSVLKMIPVLNALVVFCLNGIWAITGSRGTGFTANDYTVNKISAIKNISHTSFASVEGLPYWWNLEGIYNLTLDPQTNAFRVISITDGTIKTFYDEIPSECKQFARGVYNPIDRMLVWVYRSTASDVFEDKYTYDRTLTFSLLNTSFYPWSISIFPDTKIISIINIFGFSGSFVANQVVRMADNVVNGADNVVSFGSTNSGTSSVIKYFTSTHIGGVDVVTFSENFDTRNRDWFTLDNIGVAYDSYFVTGYAVHGQGVRKFQTNYVYMYSDNYIDNSFKILGQWNYSVFPDTGKWSTEQVFYNVADSFAYKAKKIKIRGHGLACQFRVSNNGDDPFNIIGWSVFESANKWV